VNGELVPPLLQFVRCSLCAEPLGTTHRLDRAAGTLWCWAAADGVAVGVGLAGDERFVDAE
jgi:hypothetical protein